MTENKNAELAVSLRQAADYLESHPDLPKMTMCWLATTVYDKAELRQAARAMGSFVKNTSDHFYMIVRAFGDLKVEVSIPRNVICKKVVTWDCPEESLLEDLESEPVEAQS